MTRGWLVSWLVRVTKSLKFMTFKVFDILQWNLAHVINTSYIDVHDIFLVGLGSLAELCVLGHALTIC